MLTSRWMPWAVALVMLLSAGLVCGAAWYTSGPHPACLERVR